MRELFEAIEQMFKIEKKIELKLRGEPIYLKRFKWEEIVFNKRIFSEAEKLRNKFGNNARKDFLTKLIKKPDALKKLKNAGITDDEIKLLKNGKVPKGWNVHHKLPLEDGGNNNFENLVLIKNEPYHYALSAYQKTATKGMKEGEAINIKWPIYDGYIYP